MRKHFDSWLVACALGTITVTQAAVAAEFNASTYARASNGGGAPTGTPDTHSDSSPVSASNTSTQSTPDATTTATSFASADANGMKASTSAVANNFFRQAHAGTDMIPGATAAATTNDLVLSGLGATVTSRLNLDLDGTFNLSVPSGNNNGSATLGRVNVSVSVSIFDDQNTYMSDSGSYTATILTPGAAPTLSRSGLLSGYTGGAIALKTAEFEAPANTPLMISLQLNSSSEALNNSASPGISASADFFHTFTFAKGSPVFDLPLGQTANIADLGVVNNTYVLPEPASLAIGLAAVAYPAVRWRRRVA